MDQERIAAFINSFDTSGPTPLGELEEKAKQERIPIIRHEMLDFLHVFLELKKPESILEAGTGTGFSASFFASATEAGSRITTIEKDPGRAERARENFRYLGYDQKITLIEGDVLEIFHELEGPYDFIFMDAAKGQYINLLPDVLRLLAPGGILISDNVLQEGDMLESHYLVERRNRTICKRMREYLYALKHTPELITTIVPIGDGAAVSVKSRGTKRENTC